MNRYLIAIVSAAVLAGVIGVLVILALGFQAVAMVLGTILTFIVHVASLGLAS